MSVKPVLVLGWGNRSRGDDALGPMCVGALQSQLTQDLVPRVDFLDDYQLQVEFALDLVGRQAVLFIDASVNCEPPFQALTVQARRDSSLSSHALTPQALLQVFADLQGDPGPAATLLAIRGEAFGLGLPLSALAQAHLNAATRWAQDWLAQTLLEQQHA